MSKDDLMEQALPRLQLSSLDMKTILELSVSLLETNLTQQKELQLTKDGFPDSRLWREVQRKEGVRVFKEFQPQGSLPSGNSASCMRAGIARPEESARIPCEPVPAPGVPELRRRAREHVVCTFFRQKTTTLVECYSRGYFDFHSTNDMLNNISLHTISTQWLSMARHVECAQMKKLVWWMRVRTGRDSFASSSQSSSSTSSGGISAIRQNARPRMQAGLGAVSATAALAGFCGQLLELVRAAPSGCANAAV
ncbi:hypothetical protein PRIC2_014574 [Phytophthora ramorum]